jgi:hypothetical protein
VHGVATDFANIVYIPLRFDKYLLQNAARADLVVVARHINKHTPFFVKPKLLIEDLTRDGRFVLAGTLDDYNFYLGSHVKCESEAAETKPYHSAERAR